jgi:hypothetical protein
MKLPPAGTAPRPPLSKFFEAGPVVYIDGFILGPGAVFTKDGVTASWLEAVINPPLSKEPGPDGAFYNTVERTTAHVRYNKDTKTYFLAHSNATPLPTIAKPPEVKEDEPPEDMVLLYGPWYGREFETPEFRGYKNGSCAIRGRHHTDSQDLDYTCPVTGIEVRHKANTGVWCIRSGGIQTINKHSRPGLWRLLGWPVGWYGISSHVGTDTKFNTAFCRFTWGWTPKILIVLSGIRLMLSPNIALAFWLCFCPYLLWLLIYSPTKLHKPRRFFYDDGAEIYFSAKHFHKASIAEEWTLLDYALGPFSQQNSR